MPVRACVPARARHHLWEERCALRPRLQAARWGERLPWRAERSRILIGGHGYCPHSCPPLATLSSHSFLQLPSSLGLAPSAHALHSDPEPLVPGSYRLIFPVLEVQPVRPNDDSLVLRGYLPGRVGAGAKRALQQEAQVSLGKKATTLRRVRAKERETQTLQSCLSMRSCQRLTQRHTSPASSSSPSLL